MVTNSASFTATFGIDSSDVSKPLREPSSGLTSRSVSYLQELEEGRRVAALVVKNCGELYMPIFDKFDQAILARQDAEDRLSLVLNSQAPVRHVPRRKPQRAHRKKDGRSS